MNLYSNKQKWKIVLLIVALLLVGASLFVSNQIVSKVASQERQRAQQWAGMIKKRVELIQLTDRTFSQLREKEKEKMKLWVEASKEIAKPTAFSIPEFPMQIVKDNNDIPVILLDNHLNISGYRNINIDIETIKKKHPQLSKKELNKALDDSLRSLALLWEQKNPAFTVEVYQGLFMKYVYDDSKDIARLERERDSLFKSFNKEIIDDEGLIPVLLLNQESRQIIGTNIKDSILLNKDIQVITREMTRNNDSIVIDFNNGERNVLYFDSSPVIKQLQYFPYIQFLIIGLFVFIGYLLFSTFRKAEQNQVWAGMAKETAHQLGTPISSLMAWIELLKSNEVDAMIVSEMQKDIDRLNKVTDRFSKIGSEANLDNTNLSETVLDIVNYLQHRISKQINFITQIENNVHAPHSSSLISWVIENIAKNAIDAMEGKGELQIQLKTTPEFANIYIIDTGKGMTPQQIRSIFKPGYTTKKRGWGLGLTLVKRIIEEYHNGKVIVEKSQVGEGTTFKVSIPM
ncbi:MAG: HAMP domain-containing histidine kinase [Crocinitomicaceae bacterium]|nr:HAMP domain-containing histidine kinase [Crocinitomicaceae bacterium]